jgi:penicillin-insensitive murein endopeptidase
MKLTALLLLLLATTFPAQEASGPLSDRVKAARRQIEEIRRSKKPSISIGTRSDCRLENSAELPPKGVGYVIGSPGRATHFGTDEMVFGLIELGARVADRFGEDAAFRVGDISARDGGRLAPHINHQGGRDADIGMFVCDANGRPQSNRMVKFDREGKARDGLRFDVARNWEFISMILESPHFQDLHAVLVADWLKALMLDHARAQLPKIRNPREAQRQAALIKKAEQELVQPSSSPHDDHFHLALACTAEDRKGG